LVFLGGIAGDEGQKAAGIVVILLLWRIARIVDGKLPSCWFLLLLGIMAINQSANQSVSQSVNK